MGEPTALDWWTFWVGLVGSVATVAALVAAIVLGVHEVRGLRRENAERDADRRTEAARQRRAQAETVSAQVNSTESFLTGALVGRRREAASYDTYALVVNASPLPIYDVTVLVPQETDPDLLERQDLLMVAGGASDKAWLDDRATDSLDGQPATVHFRDAAGVRWVRHRDGKLTEPRPPPELDVGAAGEGDSPDTGPADPQTQ